MYSQNTVIKTDGVKYINKGQRNPHVTVMFQLYIH